MSIEAATLQAFREVARVDATLDSTFESLGVCSLDLVCIVQYLEQSLDIAISDECFSELAHSTTVKHFAEVVDRNYVHTS